VKDGSGWADAGVIGDRAIWVGCVNERGVERPSFAHVEQRGAERACISFLGSLLFHPHSSPPPEIHDSLYICTSFFLA
jgi:hypothetical protein